MKQAQISQTESTGLLLDSVDKRIAFAKNLFNFDRLINNFREQLFVTYFNSENKVIHHERLAWGLGQSVSFDPSTLVNQVKALGSRSIMLTHNHPDGDPTPTLDDAVTLRKIEELLIEIGTTVSDSIIITKNRHYSFEESGRLKGIKSRAFLDSVS